MLVLQKILLVTSLSFLLFHSGALTGPLRLAAALLGAGLRDTLRPSPYMSVALLHNAKPTTIGVPVTHATVKLVVSTSRQDLSTASMADRPPSGLILQRPFFRRRPTLAVTADRTSTNIGKALRLLAANTPALKGAAVPMKSDPFYRVDARPRRLLKTLRPLRAIPLTRSLIPL